MKHLIKWFALAFSEGGNPSSKRICGGAIILVVAFCTVWCTILYGLTETVKSLLEIEIITSCSLLGLSNITDIWKQPTSKGDEE